MQNNDLILGAIGVLQFEVTAWRLREEYGVDCVYSNVAVAAVRWLSCEEHGLLDDFCKQAGNHIALDSNEQLTYLAPSMVNLELAMERWPAIRFNAVYES